MHGCLTLYDIMELRDIFLLCSNYPRTSLVIVQENAYETSKHLWGRDIALIKLEQAAIFLTFYTWPFGFSCILQGNNIGVWFWYCRYIISWPGSVYPRVGSILSNTGVWVLSLSSLFLLHSFITLSQSFMQFVWLHYLLSNATLLVNAWIKVVHSLCLCCGTKWISLWQYVPLFMFCLLNVRITAFAPLMCTLATEAYTHCPFSVSHASWSVNNHQQPHCHSNRHHSHPLQYD